MNTALTIPNFFIVGTRRSGTTLLSALLSEHPDVFVVNDSWMYRAFNDAMTPSVEKALRRALRGLSTTRSCLPALTNGRHLPRPGAVIMRGDVLAFLATLKGIYNSSDHSGWMKEYSTRVDEKALLAEASNAASTRGFCSHWWRSN